MKRMLVGLILTILCASVTWGADLKDIHHIKLRKALAISACAASSFDVGTTAIASRNPHLRESGLLAGANGKPLMWSMSILKGASCGVGLYMAWHPRRSGDASLYGSAGATALLGYIGFHNLELIRKAGQ